MLPRVLIWVGMLGTCPYLWDRVRVHHVYLGGGGLGLIWSITNVQTKLAPLDTANPLPQEVVNSRVINRHSEGCSSPTTPRIHCILQDVIMRRISLWEGLSAVQLLLGSAQFPGPAPPLPLNLLSILHAALSCQSVKEAE